jgi:hypothetical protein
LFKAKRREAGCHQIIAGSPPFFEHKRKRTPQLTTPYYIKKSAAGGVSPMSYIPPWPAFYATRLPSFSQLTNLQYEIGCCPGLQRRKDNNSAKMGKWELTWSNIDFCCKFSNLQTAKHHGQNSLCEHFTC